MQIKVQTGKLSFQNSLRHIITTQRRQNDLRILTIKPKHIYELEQLPLYHRDPFDRIIIAQTRIENFTLITSDSAFSAYPVVTLN